MTENKNLRQHGEVITWIMTEEERLEYIKTSNHPNRRTTDKAAGFLDERLDVMTVISRRHRAENRN